MFNIILHQPEIPQNTGNIIRLCANTANALHLIKPLGFVMNSAKMRRAGLDYHEFATVHVHETLDACLQFLQQPRLFALSTKASKRTDQAKFRAGDALLFGAESKGLPAEVFESIPASQRLTLPMAPNSRSMNLSNAVAVVVYEAWRQNHFEGAKTS